MSAKHTPGPWLALVEPTECEGVNVRFSIDSGLHFGICGGQSQEHLIHNGIKEDECRANAQLIASAPDLLEALQSCVDHGIFPSGSQSVRAAARAAIAKATGEPE
jgi:hypothetical protein